LADRQAGGGVATGWSGERRTKNGPKIKGKNRSFNYYYHHHHYTESPKEV
jgi:hypothetical protein